MNRYPFCRLALAAIASTAMGGIAVTATAQSPQGRTAIDAGDETVAPPTLQRDYFDAETAASPSDRSVITLRPPNEAGGSESGGGESSTPMSMARQLRMQRAQYQAKQRMLRREHMLWSGQVPLRPGFNATPMTTSRYKRPTIYVPIIVQ